jgi:hypothetical protein
MAHRRYLPFCPTSQRHSTSMQRRPDAVHWFRRPSSFPAPGTDRLSVAIWHRRRRLRASSDFPGSSVPSDSPGVRRGGAGTVRPGHPHRSFRAFPTAFGDRSQRRCHRHLYRGRTASFWSTFARFVAGHVFERCSGVSACTGREALPAQSSAYG